VEPSSTDASAAVAAAGSCCASRGDAHLPAAAAAFAEIGQDLLGALGVAEAA
jgi:hypothetical protein